MTEAISPEAILKFEQAKEHKAGINGGAAAGVAAKAVWDAYIRTKTDDDWRQMVLPTGQFAGHLDKSSMADECEITRNVFRSKKDRDGNEICAILNSLHALEAGLRKRGVLPPLVDKKPAGSDSDASGEIPKRDTSDRKSAKIKGDLKAANEEIARLRIKVELLEDELKKHQGLECIAQAMNDLMRIPQ
ncbi:hypothetical protein [Photobacterium lipolyticum]|uniref:Uncharacterized protein n=1 Tax=Photobacterium lipolyticum TaxID=266810 RepID=A0A2T3MW53_9GAMM|nr:hypothetical protein [Photobacterium lipolyticum]PSW04184.1 hypothetical protein C9I89_14495 [Photobacterium lipolyticum]